MKELRRKNRELEQAPAAGGARGLEQRLESICKEADEAINDGATYIILSDRKIDSENAPIPTPLATAAVHHHLVRNGKRTQIGLIVESGEPRENHHFAVLLGYGAEDMFNDGLKNEAYTIIKRNDLI